MAHIIGILCTDFKDATTQSSFVLFYKSLLEQHSSTTVFEVQQGTLLCLSFIFSRLIQRLPDAWKSHVETKDFDEYIISLEALTTKDLTGASRCISEIGRVCILPESLLFFLETQLKEQKDNKVQENLIFAYGQCGLTGNRKRIIGYLLSLYDFFGKNIDICFCIGEALASIIGGWDSKHMENFKDLDIEYVFHGENLLAHVLENCLLVSDGSLIRRKAVSIWLYCICQSCGELVDMIPFHQKLHNLFITFMTDKDGSSYSHVINEF